MSGCNPKVKYDTESLGRQQTDEKKKRKKTEKRKIN